MLLSYAPQHWVKVSPCGCGVMLKTGWQRCKWLCPAPTERDNSSMKGYLLVATSKVSFFYFPGIFASIVLTVVYVNHYIILGQGLSQSLQSFKLVLDVINVFGEVLEVVLSSTSFSMEVCLFSRNTFLTSFSSVDPSLHLFVIGTVLVTHSSHTIMFPFIEGSSVVWNVLCLQLLHVLYMQEMPSSLHTLACTMSLGDDCFYDFKLVQLLNLQAKVFMCFASTCFSVSDSLLANPKWLKFKELSLGKIVPGILRQKYLMKICHSVRKGSLTEYLAVFQNFSGFPIYYSGDCILMRKATNKCVH